MQSVITDKTVHNELKKISEKNGGLLLPPDVVEAAKPKDSPLHDYFEWDNKKASDEYRLYQARNLIRVCVTFLDEPKKEPMRVFVSLSDDRAKEGGYRETVVVMSNKKLADVLLQDAKAEMETFISKYQRLKELSEVFRAMKDTLKKLK